MNKRIASFALGLFACLATAAAQPPQQSFVPLARQKLITNYVEEHKLVTLRGGTHPLAKAKFDHGRVADELVMEHLFLQLKRSPAQQAELDRFVVSLHDRKSPQFHQWIRPEEYGRRFGLAQADIDNVTQWLRNHGFTVHNVFPNMVVDFTGTAGQVREAFHTEIHKLDVDGAAHIANMSEAQVPAALGPAIVGIVSLHDFMPKPMNHTEDTTAGGKYIMTVEDLHTIYNFGPVYSGGHTGAGMTIAIMSESDAYNSTGSSSDWNTFRNTLGIPTSTYTTASLTTVHPAPGSGGTACTDPGLGAAEAEAAIDVEWSSAAAPGAAIVLAACKNTASTGGVFIALQNILSNGDALPNVVSISYGSSELALGAAGNSFLAGVDEMAVAAGISVFNSGGDSGADQLDKHDASGVDENGINVNGFASTPYDVAVGGTDFEDKYLGELSTYWNSSNDANYGSAKSYIPEIPWNNSCGSVLLAKFTTGNSSEVTYGTDGFCNAALGYIDNGGGGGGPSACATGSGATCAGYAKPSWQSVYGNPSDGVRDIPDVALFAAAGTWSHSYAVCWSDGTPCTGAPNTWSLYGGTSVSTPIFAGIQALINQATGQQWGDPAPEYYAIAAGEYGPSGSATCNSSLGNGIGSSCVFHDVTVGDNDMPCDPGTPNCYAPSGEYGVLSLSTTAYEPAYAAASGWDFTTGVGTPNVANLVAHFASSPAVMLSPMSGSKLPGASATFHWTPGTGVTQYTLYVGTTPGAHDVAFVNAGTNQSATVSAIPQYGATLYVTLYSLIHGAYQSNAYTYIEAGTGIAATMTSPAPGSKLTSSSATFTWGGGEGVTQYSLYVGTTSGAHDIAFINAGTKTSVTVSGIPTNGATFYVTLYSLISSKYESHSYTYVESGTGAPATLTSPTGSTISGSSATFQWTAGTGVANYSLYVGTTRGGHDLDFIPTTARTASVTNLPANGSTIYVTVNSLIGGKWQSVGYSFTNP